MNSLKAQNGGVCMFGELSKMLKEITVLKNTETAPTEETASQVSELMLNTCEISTQVASTLYTLQHALINESDAKGLIEEAINDLNNLKRALI